MKSFIEIMIEGYISLGECLKHYERIADLYYNNTISAELWDKFCVSCLEELMKNNKKVLDKLKSM